MELFVKKQDITDSNCEAIVNASNTDLLPGGGVCGAIFLKAGRTELQAACNRIGGCRTGYAVITPGFRLKAKYIIHAVGPIYEGPSSNRLLAMAYYNSLKLANDNGVKSIAFPSISTGIYGFPKKEAVKIAFKAVEDFQHDYPKSSILSVTFYIIDDDLYKLFREAAQFSPNYFAEEIIGVLDATRSFDFAVRPFYMMFLNNEISREQLIHRLSLFGLNQSALMGLPDKNLREIILDMDSKVEKHLSNYPKKEWEDSFIKGLQNFWDTKIAYPSDGLCSPRGMDDKIEDLYFGKPPVIYAFISMAEYVFCPSMVSKKAYRVNYQSKEDF